MTPMSSFASRPLLASARHDEAPPATTESPFPLWLGLLVPIAILVYWVGYTRLQRSMSGSRLEPRGRRFGDSGDEFDREFNAIVERAERRDVVTPIAEARAVPVMIRGTLTNADGNLGGKPGRECVWRNRAGGRRDAAVAAEFVSIADASGRAVIEHLDQARVIAPGEQIAGRRESCSLYLGDEVEIIGMFKPERIGDDPDPTRLVYGNLGSSGPLQVRLLERPQDDVDDDAERKPAHTAD